MALGDAKGTRLTTQLTGFRIFIASPGGLTEVRNTFRAVLEKYNVEDAIRRKVVFIPVAWEATLGGLGRPQALINRELEECDALVLVLQDRWGSESGAPDGATSGTEEEYRLANRCHADPDKPMKHIQVFFMSVAPNQIADPGKQLRAVLDFKSELERERQLMYYQFESVRDFEDRLRAFLASCVHELETAGNQAGQLAGGVPDAVPADSVSGPTLPELPRAGADEAGPTEAPLDRARRLVRQGLITLAETIMAERATGAGDVEAMLDYGEFLAAQHRKTQAAAMYERAANLARAVNDVVLLGRAQVGDSRLLARLGRNNEAVLTAREAVAHLAAEKGPYSAEAQVNLADLLSGPDERPEQDALLANAEALLDVSPRPALLARTVTVRARLAQEDGDHRRSAGLYADAIRINEEAGLSEDLGDLHVGRGSALEELGELNGAREAYLAAEEVLERARDLSKLADAVDHLGRVAETLGHDDEAQRAYDKAAGLFETTQRHDAAADAYASLGKLHEAAGRTGEAEVALRQAIALAADTKERDELQELYSRLDALIAGQAGAAAAPELSGDGAVLPSGHPN